MTDLDLEAIKARAAIRPGALLTALRCVPDGEIRHGCVISDGAQTKDAIRAAYRVACRDVPDLLAEVEWLRVELRHAREERDLAVAHDRQPYPTASAYEATCRALRDTQAQRDGLIRRLLDVCSQRDEARAELARIRLESVTGGET